MKYKMLRFSLLSILAMFFGGQVYAQDSGGVSSVTDELTLSTFGVSGTSYKEVTDVTATSTAVYAAQMAGGNSAIQLRSNNNNSGIVTTASGGTVKSIKVEWNSNTADARTLVVYGKSTAYSAATELYDSESQGTEIASFSKADGTKEITIEGTYEYIGFRSNSGAMYIDKITIVWEVNGTPDERIATTVTVGEDQTGTAGSNMELPIAVVNDAAGAPIEGAVVVWSSSNEQVAKVDGTVLQLLAAGEATITATYDGDNTYKGSRGSFKVTVTAAAIDEPFTSLKALQEAVTATSTPVTIQFNDVFVTAVKGSNAYLADAQGYGILVYTKDHGLEAGQVLNGTIEANLLLYKGQTEITGFSTEGLTITTTELTPEEKTIDAITAANQSTLVTLKGVTFSSGKLSDGTNEITYYDNFSAGSLEEGATYDITGIVIVFNTTLEIAPRSADDIVKKSGEEPVDQRQELTLSFPQESYEAILGEDFEEPVLTVDPAEYDGMISYKSSDASVATVSYEGLVTLVGPGTVIITAEAMASQTYKEAEASYTLIVNERETPPEPEELANPYTYTFEAKTFEKESTLTLANANWTLATDAGYFGYDGTKGQQIGSGSKPATAITLSTADIPGTITKIVVNTSGANSIDATFSVSVGETSFQYIDEEENTTTSASLTKEATDYTFTGSASGAIILSWANNSAKAIYVKSIYVEYTTEEPVEPAGFRDIRADLTQLQSLATESDVYIKVAEDGTISQADNAEEAAATLKGKWHSTNYGWSNFTASVPVEGCVKITYATHDYGNDIIVTNSEGAEVAKLNTNGAKWSSNHENVVVAYYRTNEPTTLYFSNANYNPYFAVEAIDEADLPAEVAEYTVTFDAANSGAEGVAPEALTVKEGEAITIPANRTLYKADYTLTAWTDAAGAEYKPGDELTVNGDITLTPLFTENDIENLEEGETVTAIWDFQQQNGAPVLKYEGQTGIYVTQINLGGSEVDLKLDFDATSGKINNASWQDWCQINAGTKFTIPAVKGMTVSLESYNATTTTTIAGSTEYTTDGNVVTYTYEGSDKTIDIVIGDGSYFRYLKAVVPIVIEEYEFVYRDFEIDLLGDLLMDDEKQQGQELSFGVAVNEDGSQTRVAVDDPTANAVLSGTYHNDHGWRNFKAVVPVAGSVRITMSTCSWGSDVTVTDANGLTVAEFTTQKGEGGSGCYGGGKSEDPNTVSVVYKGGQTTLTISGGGYVNFFAIRDEIVEEPLSQDITGTWTYANADVMAATMALSGSTEAGEVEAAEKNGLMMIVEANGASFRNNGNNIQVRTGAVFKIPVKNAGDLITVKGYPGYSYYTIGNSTVELNDENTYTAKRSDAEAGYVAVTSTNDNNYYLSLSVVQYAPKEKITLDNEPAIVTFPFNEGTEGQKATFSNDDYFLNSKVTYGSNLILKDKSTLTDAETQEPVDQTRFEPLTKLNNADEQSAVRFMFTPKPGFTFQPTKVALNVTRYGTDNGLFDVTWEVAGGENIVLATGEKPARNNQNPNITKVSYDMTNAPATEGTQTLLVHLYSLQESKQFGVNDIVIEGILNGTEKDVPVLASFKVNGNEYAAEDVFGEAFEATLELPKTEQMVSQENPLTDVTAASGEVGELIYTTVSEASASGSYSACTVTIPMTAGETTMAYVLNVVYKPDFTLEYIGVDGSVLATQTVEKDAAIGEFAYDINEAPATKEGYKARGWFKTAVLGEKYSTEDIITANTKLYAIQTEIEEASTHKKYYFDLADKFFYAEDHEAFNPAGEGFYYHDAQHGWAFKNENTVDLLVGPKATITVILCQYGSGTGIVVKKGDEVLQTLPGIAEGDGGTAVFNYEGEPGTLTLEMQCGGEMYIHGMKIVNTAEVNFESQGNWYFVKAGDAGSLLDVIDVVNGINANSDAERSFIFLPDGTYDLDATVKTAITGHNISLIGQSMDKTIIVTKPDKSVEGLGKADLFDVSGTNLYMQDLTLQNALDYYAAGSAGRAAVLQDAGNRTIGKNVRMLSYQDTYYSSNSSQQAYWETCDIHGTVDFICGGGDIRFQNTTISLEPRQTSGKGGRTITAPTTTTQFGYVFDGCTVVDLANGQGDWNFGRTWQNEPICVYLNTTLDDNAKNTLVGSRWTQQGMNKKDPKLFGEYGTKDVAGNNITPASNTITSFGGNFETILTADQAAGFAYDKMFTDWDPAMLARQLDAPVADYNNGKVTWVPANNGAIAYALFLNDEFVGLTEECTFDIQIAEGDVLTLRAANACGGFGEPVKVDIATGISEIANGEQAVPQTIYNINGIRVQKAQKGLYIINGKKVVVK